MKLLALTLAFAAFTAQAADQVIPTVSLGYDYDHATSSAYKGTHQLKLGVALDTRIGTVDGVIIGDRLRGQAFSDSAAGFELGYGGGMPLGPVGLKGRIAYGRLNDVQPNGNGFRGNTAYLSFGGEVGVPVTSTVNAFGGYEYKHPMRESTPNQNRYTVGVDAALTKDISARVGYARTIQSGIAYNGVTTAVSYSF